MAISWWAPSLEARLSQGDLIEDSVFAIANNPLTPLTKHSWQGQSAWKESAWAPDSSGRGHVLAAGRRGLALVLTHSCELDKARSKGRVLVCPVQPMAAIPPEQQPEIYAQKPWSKMPLPSITNVGDGFADLHLSMPVDRRVVDAAKRAASMTKDARHRLKLQLIAFYTRLDARASTLPDEDANAD